MIELPSTLPNVHWNFPPKAMLKFGSFLVFLLFALAQSVKRDPDHPKIHFPKKADTKHEGLFSYFHFLSNLVPAVMARSWSSLVEGDEQHDQPNSQTCSME